MFEILLNFEGAEEGKNKKERSKWNFTYIYKIALSHLQSLFYHVYNFFLNTCDLNNDDYFSNAFVWNTTKNFKSSRLLNSGVLSP